MSQPQSSRYSTIIGRPMDNTALSAYTRCPRLYWISYDQHYRHAGPPTPALNYGSGFHNVMQFNYKSEVRPREDLEEQVHNFAFDRWQLSTDPTDYRSFDRLLVEYEKYLDHWGLPWDEPGETLGWPDAPLVEIGVDLDVGVRHPYAGKIDRFFRLNGNIYIEDHKTASQLRSDYFKQWEIDNQMIGYATLAGEVIGEPVVGVRINLHVIRKSDSVFERKTVMFSEPRKKAWKLNYDSWLGRIEESKAIMEASGDLTRAFPQNFSACAGKYGMCVMAGVCADDPAIMRATLDQYFERNPWNPLEADDVAD